MKPNLEEMIKFVELATKHLNAVIAAKGRSDYTTDLESRIATTKAEIKRLRQ